jgi:hypothetical protein
VLDQIHERGAPPGGHLGTPFHPGGRLPPAHRPDAGRLMPTVASTGATDAVVRDDRRPVPAHRSTPAVRLLADGLPAHLEGLDHHVVRVAALLRAGHGGPARAGSSTSARAGSRVLRRTSPSSCRPDRGPGDADRGLRDDLPGDGAP